MRLALSIVLVPLVLVGCASKNSDDGKIPLGQVASSAAGETAPAAQGPLFGTVLEQIPAGQYVYLRIKIGKRDVWAAVPAATVAVGAEVQVSNPMLMTKFESKTLKRTFDEVYFGSLAQAGVASAAPAPSPAPAPLPAGNGSPTAPAMDVGKVAKASGPDARTIAQLWSEKAGLAGRTVTIRGVVVKATDGVMGKNWIHLQDGSGDAKLGSNDITVTSLDRVAKGETVTITGTVRTDKDFGAGYSYAVIVEDAKVAKK